MGAREWPCASGCQVSEGTRGPGGVPAPAAPARAAWCGGAKVVLCRRRAGVLRPVPEPEVEQRCLADYDTQHSASSASHSLSAVAGIRPRTCVSQAGNRAARTPPREPRKA